MKIFPILTQKFDIFPPFSGFQFYIGVKYYPISFISMVKQSSMMFWRNIILQYKFGVFLAEIGENRGKIGEIGSRTQFFLFILCCVMVFYYCANFYVSSIIFVEIRGGGGIHPPQVTYLKKKPRSGRVKSPARLQHYFLNYQSSTPP